MTATEHVILVDEEDNPIGTAEKIMAHQQGLCHRAFSIFIVRDLPKPAILLQQRADNKYHSPGLWTNTCCSHPRPNESTLEACHRRLKEEMGITATLQWTGHFHYIAHFDNGLVENEVDHVFIGTTNDVIQPNPAEVQNYQWIEVDALKMDLLSCPQKYTPWLSEALKVMEKAI